MKLFSLSLAVLVLGMCLSLKASEMDDRISTAFQNSYNSKVYLSGESVSVVSKDGVVTLSGQVSNTTQKQMAQDTAAALPGVKSVDNRLVVKSSDLTMDTWTAAKVKVVLALSRDVSASQTEVSVKDGVVTLKGVAASQAQKDLTAKYAKDVAGIKSVINEMTVSETAPKPSETIGEMVDDVSITSQVKMALLLHSSTSKANVDVTTTKGVVTITGKAKSVAEKDTVAMVVSDVNGVKSVINNMVIAVDSPKAK